MLRTITHRRTTDVGVDRREGQELGGRQAGAAPLPSGAPAAKQGAEQLENFDARAASAAKPAAVTQRALAAAAKPGSAVRELRESLGLQGIVEIDKTTGTPRRVAKLDGFLTGATSQKPEKIALD
jgi:hypothetical protein